MWQDWDRGLPLSIRVGGPQRKLQKILSSDRNVLKGVGTGQQPQVPRDLWSSRGLSLGPFNVLLGFT